MYIYITKVAQKIKFKYKILTYIKFYIFHCCVCNEQICGQNTSDDVHQQIKYGDTFLQVCEHSRYRSYDGSCNNLRNPTWGLANTRYGRLVRPRYGDGK